MTNYSPPKNLSAFLWHFIKKDWKWFLLMQFFLFAWSIDHTIFPLILSLLIDAIANFQGDRANMWTIIAFPVTAGISLWVVVELSYRLGGFISAYLFPRLEAAIRMEMFDYVQRHSFTYFSRHFAGSLANKISDMPQAATAVVQLIIYLFFPVILALTISTVLFARLNLFFALILLGWILIHTSVIFYFSRRCDDYSNVHSEARSVLSGKIVDSFTNHLNTRLFSRYFYEKTYLQKYQKDEQQKQVRSKIYIEKMKACLGLLSFFGPGIILNWYMLYSWQHEVITTGEVVFIFNTAWNITIMAWLAGLEMPNLFKEIGICRQALTIIQDPHDITDAKNAKPIVVTSGNIIFDHVCFHYIPGRIIFDRNNTQLKAGEKVGLVGYSGSGKTTFVHLILRYFDIEEGKILIDQQDISEVTQESLRNQIAMIPQDISLFHRSLMDNIRYGRIDASDEEVIQASKRAHCHDFIMQMPDQYQTLAGERGVKLSGGQRQRIAIARAFLKNARILILDEATSALDSMTEKLIQDGLQDLMEGRTCIVIAHRLSTLSGMDRILVFNEGKIIEDGTHQELLRAKDHYYTMWEMQAGGFLPEEAL